MDCLRIRERNTRPIRPNQKNTTILLAHELCASHVCTNNTPHKWVLDCRSHEPDARSLSPSIYVYVYYFWLELSLGILGAHVTHMNTHLFQPLRPIEFVYLSVYVYYMNCCDYTLPVIFIYYRCESPCCCPALCRARQCKRNDIRSESPNMVHFMFMLRI